ncbi:MAG TPA: FAD-dependent oxidoreductase [Pseudonocardiaceae bacterium]|nr:FAD-dependent oxidoreductase [Pseudonocardiaceae bacterium]
MVVGVSTEPVPGHGCSDGEEVDVLVVGYGAAGAAAALSAHEAGARVLVVEKCPQPGGNSLVSSANTVYPQDPADVARFTRYLIEVCEGTTPDDVIETYVRGLLEIPDWLAAMGGELEDLDDLPMGSYYIPNLTFPQLPSAQGLRLVLRRLKQTPRCSQPTGGARMWHLLDHWLSTRCIPVRCATAVRDLVIDRAGRVSGAVVAAHGSRRQISARAGVVLACGGFAYSEALKHTYLPSAAVGALGSPGNTGDGLRLAQQAGSALWHLTDQASALGIAPQGWEAGFAINLPRSGYLYVDRKGHRFVDETRVEAHTACQLTANYDPATFDYPRVPCFALFDQENFTSGPLGISMFSYNVVRLNYQWSEDNQAELDRGWIIRAQTLDELAQILDIPVAILSQTIDRYNQGAQVGSDADYGRCRESLKPVTAPFYALRLVPLLYNTQGGPRRDSCARVLDVDGRPIPGLYAAGELGSIWGSRYQTSTNFTEALVYGRIAGHSAANRLALGADEWSDQPADESDSPPVR